MKNGQKLPQILKPWDSMGLRGVSMAELDLLRQLRFSAWGCAVYVPQQNESRWKKRSWNPQLISTSKYFYPDSAFHLFILFGTTREPIELGLKASSSAHCWAYVGLGRWQTFRQHLCRFEIAMVKFSHQNPDNPQPRRKAGLPRSCTASTSTASWGFWWSSQT